MSDDANVLGYVVINPPRDGYSPNELVVHPLVHATVEEASAAATWRGAKVAALVAVPELIDGSRCNEEGGSVEA